MGHATLRLSAEALAEWRSQLATRTGGRLTTSFLKHADEQTVAALAGVLQAAQDYGLQLERMNDWGVLSAPRYLGRVALAQSMIRFAAEGAWGLSPHVIPHRSLHSVSGTLSQALNLEGPNLGVGGGCQAGAEAVLLAGSTLAAGGIPGLWITVTGFVPEVVPTEAGRVSRPSDCCVVALALTAARPDSSCWRLSVHPALSADAEIHLSEGVVMPLSVESLFDALNSGHPTDTSFTLGAGGWLQLSGMQPISGKVC
jgi:hypothetical protein